MYAASILRQCGLFHAVQGPSFESLANMAVLRRYQRGEAIFRQGDPCPGVFIVASGLARVFLIASSGKEHVLHLVQPGQTFAEVAAIGAFPCPAFAEAAADTTCLLLPQEPFRHALESDHTLCLQLLQSFAGWVRHFMGMVEDITLRDAAGRLARFLLEAAPKHADVLQLPALKKDLASRLNLTSETLSRTLRRLGELGLIETDGATVTLLDRVGLRGISEGQPAQD